MTDRYAIGDVVKFRVGPESKVIGIDRYTCNSYAGQCRAWTSYTLEADQPAPFDRWYVTDEDEGLFYWCVTEPFMPTGTVELELSGLCKLVSEGDSALSTPYSSVLVHRADSLESKGDHLFNAIEAFEEIANPMYFNGGKTRPIL